jgi:negative regulator of sigma E activity
MSRKAISFILGLVVVAAAAGAVRFWPRRVAAPMMPASKDAMKIVSWAMHSCYGLNRTGVQVTTVAAGKKQVTSRVEVAYRCPGMMRLRYLSGPLVGVRIWQDVHRVYRYLPEKRRLEVTPKEASRPAQLEKKLQLLEKNYQAVLEGRDLVAGRTAHRIMLRSRHPGNPWKRLWIDRKSYLMVGSEDYDSHDRLLRSTRFTSLALQIEPEKSFQPPATYLKRVVSNPAAEGVPLPPEQISRRVGFEILLPRYVPPGYQLIGSFVNRDKCACGDETARSVYSDGLNAISVFQCGRFSVQGGACWGANVPDGVRFSRGSDSFVLVGELDRAELEKMAQSLPPRSAQMALQGRAEERR